MTTTNPHPLANPFNQRKYQNYNFGRHLDKVISIPTDPRNLTVPEPSFGNPSSSLQVPESQPYYGAPSAGTNGFIGDSSLFQLADGSVIDTKTKKIVHDPNKKFKDQGYWNDPNAETSNNLIDDEWRQEKSIGQMMSELDAIGPGYDPNTTPESSRYWKMAEEESKKLEQNLTDEQKNLLDELNSGKMFPLAKLIDEN